MTKSTGVLVGGRYALLDAVGRGGMGTVWRARDELLGRDVAVKEILPPLGLSEQEQEQLAARTLREARAAARISSRAAVTVYDVVEQDGRPWIVMELLEARSLAEAVRDGGPLPPAQVARIGLELLDALDAAHRAGVVHRDVKPGNVLLAHDGRVVLTDFGIAALDGDPSLTSTGTVLGSPAYMAPERAHGHELSPGMDLWALGATLYAALDGASPFQRTSALTTLNAVLTEPVPPLPASFGPLVPVLEGLLEKDPVRRLDSRRARELLAVALRTGSLAPAAGSGRSGLAPDWTAGQAVVPVDAPAAPAGLDGLGGPLITPAPEPRAVPAGAAAAPSARGGTAAFDPAGNGYWTPPPTTAMPRPPGGRPRRWLLPAVLAGLLVFSVVTATVAWSQLREPAGRTATPDRPSASSAAASSSANAATSMTPTPQTSAPAVAPPAAPAQTTAATTRPVTPPVTTPAAPQPTAAGTASSAAVPDGYRLHRDPTGFAIAVPAGWAERRSGRTVIFREPVTGRYLQIEQTDSPQPDVLVDWETNEAGLASRTPGYERIKLERVAYRNYQAADWDFRRDSTAGPVRVRNRNIRVSDDQAYSLLLSVPEESWQDSLPLFTTFARTFQPAEPRTVGRAVGSG